MCTSHGRRKRSLQLDEALEGRAFVAIAQHEAKRAEKAAERAIVSGVEVSQEDIIYVVGRPLGEAVPPAGGTAPLEAPEGASAGAR